MLKLEFINARGDRLALHKNDYFHLINIVGQTSAATSISSLALGDLDGNIINNVQAQPRTIIFDLRIKSNENVEEAKRAILKVIKLKQRGTLIWTQNGTEKTISGIVESVDMPRWNNEVTMQVSLHCDQPFWEDIDAVVQEISEALPLHYFTDDPFDMLYFPEEGIPFSEYDFSRMREINNAGDVSIGLEIEIIAYDTVTNPIIYDTDNNFFGVGYGTGAKKVVMQQGDIIKISTVKGRKTVTLNGVSMLGKIKPLSTWLQLAAGDNTFSINSDDESIENMTFALSYKQRYI